MRDYTKESNWQKKKYTLIHGYIDKDLGDSLKTKLKRENKTIAGWIRDCAEYYLSGE